MAVKLPGWRRKQLKGLAYYQLTGGIIGLIIIAWGAIENESINSFLILIYGLGIASFGYSAFCGYKILKGELNNALKLSAINQALQIPNFFVFGFAFKYAAGLFLSIGFDYTDDFNFTLHFGLSELNFSINSSSNKILLEVNLVAIYLFYLIGSIKKHIAIELALFNSLLPDPKSDNMLSTVQNVYLEDKRNDIGN